ncbi:unnamed protein product, partial [Pylaiella littoralis]
GVVRCIGCLHPPSLPVYPLARTMAPEPNRPKTADAAGDAAPSAVVVCDNLIGGESTPPLSGSYLDVVSPSDGTLLGRVAMSGKEEVEIATARAQEAFAEWGGVMTAKSRAAVMFRFHALLEKHADELADLVVAENGKNRAEALASVAKGNETVEWACSMPQLMQGKILQVSRGIECRDLREPLGVVACLVPFNFPIMVPMWTVPIALTAGNCVILKPSEKVPLTMRRVGQLLVEAGLPPGVFQIVNGGREAAEALCDAEAVKALTFVGSSGVAKSVAARCHAVNKRVLALGGAENHLIALPDCEHETAAHDIVASFAGCAGQRCMAASVLVLVGDTGDLLDKIELKCKALQPGTAAGEVGPVISAASRDHIVGCIDKAQAAGHEVLVDGRGWAKRQPGTWVGPTVIVKGREGNGGATEESEEIFGPVLMVVKVGTWQEALAVENASPFGNAASIYTTSGAAADYFQTRFRVNVGIPVPREPFAFGGLSGTLSKYGDFDVTAEGAMEFFTNRRKITTKWALPKEATATAPAGKTDAANFVGQM